jgi:hypothetical protein
MLMEFTDSFWSVARIHDGMNLSGYRSEDSNLPNEQ